MAQKDAFPYHALLSIGRSSQTSPGGQGSLYLLVVVAMEAIAAVQTTHPFFGVLLTFVLSLSW